MSQAGFCLASCRTSSRISSGTGGRPVLLSRSFVLDQAPVPGEQGAGRHDPVQPKASRQQSRRGGDHGPVNPVQFRAGDLAAQNRDLMPQHQDLRFFRRVATGKQYKPGEVDETEEHECRG